MIDNSISHELQTKVNNELKPDEVIRWIEKPIPAFFGPKSTGAFLFAIPWTAFALFWICGAAGFQIPDFNEGADLFPLFGLPFVLIGLCMLSSPLWNYLKTSNTVYAITNQRAIIVEVGISSTKTYTYTQEQLGHIYRKEKRDGSGDVLFAKRTWKDSDGDKQTEEVGFIKIAKPREAEEMLSLLNA